MADLVVRADRPAHGGSCVARADGRVVFCRYCLPGEMVRVDAQGEPTDRFWRADTMEVLADPHPYRQSSPCPWFGPGLCGGCSWLHAAEAEQLRIKAEVLTATLARIGGVSWPVSVRSLGMVRGWRTRVTLHADELGRAGFHAVRTNDVVPIQDCLQADPGLDLPGLLAQRWPPGASVHASLSTAGRAVIVTAGRVKSVDGPEEHVHVEGGRRFTVAVDGFWQSHKLAAGLLAEEVARLAVLPADAQIVDLYAGVGLFGLSLAEQEPVARVTFVEGNRVAAAHARRNAGDDPRFQVIGRDVRHWARNAGPADLVILDPPRSGARQVVAAVADTAAPVVIYVSCEPSTLARDLASFRALGYQPDHLEGFDLFPGTSHLETVVRLRRT